MTLLLAVLILWLLLFGPIGAMIHWLVLGSGARERALPIAPITGISAATVTFAALARVGVDAGSNSVTVTVVVLALACAVAMWRLRVPWRSRELIGLALFLLLCAFLIQSPVVGPDGAGPLGYGTAANPVEEVAAIDTAARGTASNIGIAPDVRASADSRAVGFEQFAAFTAALGQGSPAHADSTWTAYGLDATITGACALLIAFPLFAFARARGVGTVGLLVLAPLGVLAPAVMLALANGTGAALLSVPCTMAAVFSLLVTRRDRGWWALVVLFGAAVAATGAPLALLPLVCIGLAWMFLRSTTYEHLSQHDTPVSRARTLTATAAASVLGVVATVPILMHSGDMLSWPALHDTRVGALLSWPFAWLDSNLQPAGPHDPLELALWLIGPALLIAALSYAMARNERRELGILVGSVLAAAFAVTVMLIESGAGIRLFEFVVVSTAPFLAVLALRTVTLARERVASMDDPSSLRGRWIAGGPLLLVCVFALLSMAASWVTGSRMVHAPALSVLGSPAASAASGGAASRSAAVTAASSRRATYIAAGDPWLGFLVSGDRADDGYVDVDALRARSGAARHRGVNAMQYDQLLLSNSPLSSDPPPGWVQQSTFDAYAVRDWVSRFAKPKPPTDDVVDQQLALQTGESSTASRPDPPITVADVGFATTTTQLGLAASRLEAPLRHDPVEADAARDTAHDPAGLLLPDGDVEGCALKQPGSTSASDSLTCQPTSVVRSDECSPGDESAARSALDEDASPTERSAATTRAALGTLQTMTTPDDDRLQKQPPLVGVTCWSVPLDSAARTLLVHLRDVGVIIPPAQAQVGINSAASDWETVRRGGVSDRGVRRATRDKATLTFGVGYLSGKYDLTLEGQFGSGVELQGAYAPTGGMVTDNSSGTIQPFTSTVTKLSGAPNGFGMTSRNVYLDGGVSVVNGAGTSVDVGRLFARPRDIPLSCNIPIALRANELREVRTETQPTAGPAVTRPGLTVAVTAIEGAGSARTAHVVVGSYLTHAGLPRYQLVDWTEQFPGPVVVTGCDGSQVPEGGADFQHHREAPAASARHTSVGAAIGGG